ncbi:MAG: HAMP domain-containing methyl-accepting chemotaxis protein [Planctomycetota bacterium]
MLKNMNLQTKILLAFGVIVAIAALLGYMGWSSIGKVNAAVAKADGATIAINQANTARIRARDFMVDRDMQIPAEVEKISDAFHANAEDLLSSLNDPTDQESVRDAAAEFETWHEAFSSYVEFEQSKQDADRAMQGAALASLSEIEAMQVDQRQKLGEDQKAESEARSAARWKAETASGLIAQAQAMRMSVLRFQATGDETLVPQIRKAHVALDDEVSKLNASLHDPADIQLINDVAEASANYKTAFEGWTTALQNDNAADLDQFNQQLIANGGLFQAHCQAIADGQKVKLDQVRDEGEAQIAVRLGNVDRVEEMARKIIQTRQAEKNFIIENEKKFVSEVNEKINEILALATDLRARFEDPRNHAEIDRIKEAVANYQAAFTNYVALVDQQDSKAVAMATAANSLRDAAESLFTVQQGKRQAASTTATSLMVGMSLGAIVLGVVLAFIIARIITKPVIAVVDMLKDIAQGEGDLTKRIEVSSKDEIGQLGEWFNVFIKKVHDIILEVKNAAGDVASASAEIASSSEEMAAGMEQQNAQVAQVSTAMEEMASSIGEVASKCSEAANQSTEAGREATSGGEVVDKTVSEIESIARQTNDAAQSVASLGEKSEQIGQIIEVINDIADQTNLLALNAAIEAARAGEHGRGFAVVADEVRKLAERTQQATEEVGRSISEIQVETRQAVERMESSKEQVQVGVDLAKQAGQALQKIVMGADTVAREVGDITAAAEQQSSASEEVSRNIEEISAVARQAAEGASQAASAASQLSSNAEQLQRLVGQFRLSER